MLARLSALAFGVLLILSLPAAAVAAADPRVALVHAPGDKPVAVLEHLGLDLLDHRPRDAAGRVAVVLHGPADRAALLRSGLSYVLERPGRASARRATPRQAPAPELPSGRTSYRTLAAYEADLDALVAAHPGTVRPITLAEPTLEGRTVRGVEIARDVAADDGRPTMLVMGLHHAREWPSGEVTMEWAIDLAESLDAGNPRVTDLLSRARVVAVPVVNPDGFALSRVGGAFEYKRKNCRVADGAVPVAGACADPANVRLGVDPNRNYGGLWGAPGASYDLVSDAYRGAGPFSEPEVRNVRALIASRTVTVAISNHTYSDLMLRPPGQASAPIPPDDALLKALGDAMGAVSGLVSQPSYALYDTSGGLEDWAYWTAGTLGYTPEIGAAVPGDSLAGFHPDFSLVGNRYPGLREAFLLGLEKAADPAAHSVVAGRAPAGAQIELTRSFTTSTSPIIQPSGPPLAPITFPDTLATTMKVGPSGAFSVAANPSTRPISVGGGRDATGPATAPIAFTAPGTTTSFPYVDPEATDAPPSAFQEIPFTIAAGDDNAAAQVRVSWASTDSDFDLFVYRLGDGGSRTLVASAAEIVGTEENATIRPPQAGGKLPAGDYLVRVVDYQSNDHLFDAAITFTGPAPAGAPESWTLRCSVTGGAVREQPVVVGRGERVDVGEACPAAAPAPSAAGEPEAPVAAPGPAPEPGVPAQAVPVVTELDLDVRPGTPRLERALREGVPVRVTCRPACGVLTGLQRRGDTLAAAGSRAPASEARLRLRFTKDARRALRDRRSVTLRLVVAGAAGDAWATARTRVTLER